MGGLRVATVAGEAMASHVPGEDLGEPSKVVMNKRSVVFNFLDGKGTVLIEILSDTENPPFYASVGYAGSRPLISGQKSVVKMQYKLFPLPYRQTETKKVFREDFEPDTFALSAHLSSRQRQFNFSFK
jgi:hypothetical protein